MQTVTSQPRRHAFDEATGIDPLGGDRFRGDVAAGWEVGDVTNGGYTMAIALRAATEVLELPDPVSSTAHFLRPARPGPCDLRVEVVRRGRRHGTANVVLVQDDRDVLRLLTTCSDLDLADGPSHNVLRPPVLPPVAACPTLQEAGTFIPRPISQHLEMRFAPHHVGFAHGRPSGEAVIAGWGRFADPRPPDVLSAAVFVDAFPPSSANLEFDVERTPTLELTVHVRARPADGWLRQVVRTDAVAGGYLIEDGELWDEAGTLVAQSRQLALTPRRDGG